MRVPASSHGEFTVQLVAQPSATDVTVPLQWGVPAGGESSGSGSGSGTGGSAGQGSSAGQAGSLPATGADTGWMGAGLLAALALLGLGVIARRRAVRQSD